MRLSKILSLLTMYMSSLISKEGAEVHSIISFIFIRSISMMSEKCFNIVEASKKQFLKKQNENRIKDEEEGRLLKDVTSWMSIIIDHYKAQMEQIKKIQTSKETEEESAPQDIDISMSTAKLSALLSLHKKNASAESINKMAGFLETIKNEMSSVHYTSVLNKERAELSDKNFKRIETEIQSAIMRREAENRMLRARE